MNKTMQDKKILVAGGASHIGYACCEEVISRGGSVILADYDVIQGEEAASDLGINAVFMQLDITQEDQWERAFQQIVSQNETLDGLINSACVYAEHDNIEQISHAEWQQIMEVNRDGTFLGCRYGIRMMRKQSCSGSIVNISSILGLVGNGNAVPYSTSQGAIRMLTKSVALYCAREKLGIRCNSVHPGRVNTKVLTRDNTDSENELKNCSEKTAPPFSSHLAKGRTVDLLGVAAVTEFLLSQESSFITGAEYVIDKGYSAI